MGLFHRHLHVLERAAPGSFTPANRLRAPDYQGSFAPRRRVGPAPLSRPGYPRASVARGSGAQMLAQTRLRQTRRRRRDVLFVLVVLVVATLVVAGVTRAQPAVLAQAATDVALVSYIALLVRLRNLAAERDLKLRVIYPQASRTRPAQAVRRPARPRAVGYAYASDGYASDGYGADGYASDDGYASRGADEYAQTGGYTFAPGYGLASGYAMASGPDLRRVAVN